MCHEDEAQGKQQTLTSLFAKGSQISHDLQTSNYTCPVCGSKITTLLSDFNRHIDSCLEQQDKQKDKCEDNQMLGLRDEERSSKTGTNFVKTIKQDDMLKCPSSLTTNSQLGLPDRRNCNVSPAAVGMASSFPQSTSHVVESNSLISRNNKRKDSEPCVEFDEDRHAVASQNVESERLDTNYEKKVSCPVCGLLQTEAHINSHLDQCLNWSTIDCMVKNNKPVEPPPAKRPKHSSSNKGSPSPSKTPSQPSVSQYFSRK